MRIILIQLEGNVKCVTCIKLRLKMLFNPLINNFVNTNANFHFAYEYYSFLFCFYID